MNTNMPVSDEEIVAACKAGSFYVTNESVKDVRKILEGFLAGRSQIPAAVLEVAGYFDLDDGEWKQAFDTVPETHTPLYRTKE